MTDKLIIALDISLNSTGICFRCNGINRFVAVVSKNSFTSSKKMGEEEMFSKFDELRLINDNAINVDIILTDRKPVKQSEGFVSNQRTQIKNAIEYSGIIFSTIKEIVDKEYDYAHDIEVCFESISYGSFGDNTMQLMEITSLIKEKLIKYILGGNVENYTSIPGPSMKSFVGHGGLCKYKMLKIFIDNKLGDKLLFEDPFYKVVANDYEKLVKGQYEKLDKKENAVIYDVVGAAGYLITDVVIKKKTKSVDKHCLCTTSEGVFDSINHDILTPKFNVKTPISDIVDAYFLALMLERS